MDQVIQTLKSLQGFPRAAMRRIVQAVLGPVAQINDLPPAADAHLLLTEREAEWATRLEHTANGRISAAPPARLILLQGGLGTSGRSPQGRLVSAKTGNRTSPGKSRTG